MKNITTLFLCAIMITINSVAQNVGINTTTPQATLDVKGGQRVGGASRYTTYDSASGKVVWKNSNLFVNSAQYIMRHSSTSEGLYYANSQLEYRYSDGTPRFYTNWSTGNGYFYGNLGIGNTTPLFPLSFANTTGDQICLWTDGSPRNYGIGLQSYLLQIHTDVPDADIAFGSGSSTSFAETMRVKGNGNVGIGTNAPGTKLHIFSGTSGYVGGYFPGIAVEGGGNTYANLITPNASESGLLFGTASNLANGGIVYNNPSDPNGLQFRTNGNATRMVIDQAGNVGIGWTSPNTPLTFPPYVGQKITLYPGATGNVGFAVQANLLQIYSDNPFADIAFGYDQAGTLTEKFRFKANGAFAISGNTGVSGQVLKSSGSGSAPAWGSPSSYLFENLMQVNQANDMNATKSGKITLPGMGKTAYTLTVKTNSKLIVSTWVHGITTSCPGCGVTNFSIETFIYKNGNPVPYANIDAVGNCSNGMEESLTTGISVLDVEPGTYTFDTRAGVHDGPDISIRHGRLFVLLIPQ